MRRGPTLGQLLLVAFLLALLSTVRQFCVQAEDLRQSGRAPQKTINSRLIRREMEKRWGHYGPYGYGRHHAASPRHTGGPTSLSPATAHAQRGRPHRGKGPPPDSGYWRRLGHGASSGVDRRPSPQSTGLD